MVCPSPRGNVAHCSPIDSFRSFWRAVIQIGAPGTISESLTNPCPAFRVKGLGTILIFDEDRPRLVHLEPGNAFYSLLDSKFVRLLYTKTILAYTPCLLRFSARRAAMDITLTSLEQSQARVSWTPRNRWFPSRHAWSASCETVSEKDPRGNAADEKHPERLCSCRRWPFLSRISQFVRRMDIDEKTGMDYWLSKSANVGNLTENFLKGDARLEVARSAIQVQSEI